MHAYRFTLLCFLLIAKTSFAQQNNTWYFGRNAGMKFTPSGPVPLHNSNMLADEGSSSICDKSGNLLFYTNGVTVYNKVHEVMSNGNDLAGNISSVQGALIVPMPGNADIYYIFTTDAIENNFAKGYNYSVVDMSLDNGKGRVTTKNVLLQASCTERLAAVRHADGNSVWIITNERNSNKFYSWLLGCNGLSSSPVESITGVIMDMHILSNNGMIKISPDGQTLCQTHYPYFDDTVVLPNFFQLFDFNPATGIISNARTINPGDAAMTGCEFSANSKLLYISRAYNKKIDQYDLSAGNVSAVTSSRYTLPGVDLPYYGIQMGPDQKIYLSSPSQDLGVINYPETSGIGCNFIKNGIDINEHISGTTFAGLPNFINDLSYDGSNNFNYIVLDSCNGTVQFSGFSSIQGNITWEWDFGDGFTSNLQNPVHSFSPALNVYQVKLKIQASGSCAVVERTKTIIPKGLQLTAGLTPNVVCDSGYVRFNNTTVYLPDTAHIQFLWDFGDGNTSTQQHPIHHYTGGTYQVKLTVKTSTPCFDRIVSQQVIMQTFDIHAGTAATIDPGQSVQLSVTGGGAGFSWMPVTGLSNPAIANPVAKPRKTTTYYVTAVNISGCRDIDSVLIKVNPIPGIKVPTGFTPNNDGKNDLLRPYINDDYNLVEFSVYNRWGEKVYSTSQKETGWNGKVNGIPQNAGVYVWIIKVSEVAGGATVEKKGSFVLIR